MQFPVEFLHHFDRKIPSSLQYFSYLGPAAHILGQVCLLQVHLFHSKENGVYWVRRRDGVVLVFVSFNKRAENVEFLVFFCSWFCIYECVDSFQPCFQVFFCLDGFR